MVKKAIKQNSGMEIPDYQYEAFVCLLLPKIQHYYESEEGKKDMADYRVKKTRQAKAGKDGIYHGDDQNGENRKHTSGDQTA